MDISGSFVNGKNIVVNFVGDKAISVGEKILKVDDVLINNSAIGIASKDLSNVIANNVSIKNTGIGLTAFQKKVEFGPASIKINLLNSNQCISLKANLML